ncbi:MAG: right-handed parallel beta-helix repeat-containing protein [Alistipes sp.]|nr:right-handed parallel beta-helix repeat-containing protein [Alistipes sp.]
MKRLLILLALILLLPAIGFATELHVATNGADSNPGTADAPFRTIQHAVNRAEAGDIIWVHGGRYVISESIRIPEKATSERRRCYLFAAGDGEVVIDGSAMHHTTKDEFRSARGIYLNRNVNYWHIKGLRICHMEDNGMKVEGSYNIIEHCTFHDNNDTGLQIGMGMPIPGEKAVVGLPEGEPIANPDYQFCRGNRVINCDSYNNADLRTWIAGEADDAGDADGFACKLYPGPGNEFYGCRAWNNSDDNWDLYMVYHPVLIDHCWAARAGYTPDGQPIGKNGNGFKMGGGGSSGGAMFPRSTGAHVIKNCIAFENRDKGFDQNYASEGMYLINNTAWGNRYNYRFEAPLAHGHYYLRNCVGFNASVCNHEFRPTDVNNQAVALDESHNSWTLLDGCNPYREGEPNDHHVRNHTADYSAEFRSLSFADFTAPREHDGSLPNNGFGALYPHSKLRNLGTPIQRVVPRRFITEKRKERLNRITIPYRGSAPDLGAREE